MLNTIIGNSYSTLKGWNLSCLCLCKKHTEEQKQKISDGNRGNVRTPEMKKHLSELKSGCHWYTNGIKNIQAFECPEGFKLGYTKPNQRTIKGKHWYNNGIINVMSYTCPDGFVQGMLKKNK